MDAVLASFAPVFLVAGILVLAILFLMALFSVLRFVRKVPASEALLVFGWRCKTRVSVPKRVKLPDGTDSVTYEDEILNYKIVRGGMTVIFPMIQESSVLDLRSYKSEVMVENVLCASAVPVTVDGIVQLAIGDDLNSIATAATLHLGKPMQQILEPATETLQGHLRAIVGLMSPDELFKDREQFSQRVSEVASGDMAGLGLVIKSFVVREITDKKGFYEALGAPQIANIKRESRIATALADQMAVQKEQDAERNKAQYDRDTRIAKANYESEVARQQAIADRSKMISTAEQDKVFESKQAEAAEIGAQRRDKELDSTRREADAARYTAEQKANAARITVEQESAAALFRAQRDAEATRATGLAEAEANRARGMAVADVEQRKLEAEAAGNRAQLLATADGTRAQLTAEAEGIRAKLLGEAEGKRELANSLNSYDENALRQVLGLALLGGIPSVAESFGSAFSNIKEVRLIEMGGVGHGADGAGAEGAVQRFLDLLPANMFKFVQGATALLGTPIDDLVAAAIVKAAQDRGVEVGPAEEKEIRQQVASKLAEQKVVEASPLLEGTPRAAADGESAGASA